jgi:predicted transposase YbfD/YdcC
MSQLQVESLFERMRKIADPRREHQKFHSLYEILVIAICAVLCGAEHWTEMEEYGEAKREWLATFLELKHGIPSHDTFRRVFLLLDTVELKSVFVDWISAAVSLSQGTLVNIAGKNLRGSKAPRQGKKALSVVSAWVSEQSVVLGQLKCAEKSNEITAIPALLKILNLEGCVVTMDARGCQKEIVEELANQSADYVIALKGNQGTLHQEVKQYLDWAESQNFRDISVDTCVTLEKDHGRIEERRCWVTQDIAWLAEKEAWANLQSVILVEAVREVIGQEKTTERRYFISSLGANAQQSLRAVRGHWAVENELHWCLDIGFREDECQIKEARSAENLAAIRHIGLNLLKQEKSCRLGIKSKRKRAGWDESYLLKVLKM